MFKFLRKLFLVFCWGLLFVVVLAAAGGVFALYHLNSQLRQYVLTELQERFPDLDITLDSVKLDEMKGITVRGFDASIPNTSRPLLHIGEVFLDYPVTLQGLYQRDFRVRKIIIRHPVFRITRNTDGQFGELQRLIPKEKAGTNVRVPVEITGGILLYEDQNAGQPLPLKITGIDSALTPGEDNVWQCTGKADGENFRRLTVDGQYNTDTKHWRCSASVRQLDWTAPLLPYLPYKTLSAHQPDYAAVLETFQGRFDLSITAAADAEAAYGFRFAVEGLLSQGRADIRKINRTLTELNTKFRITENSLDIEKLIGIAEAARIVCSYHQDGLPQPVNAKLTASIRGLAFDGKFVEMLNPFLNDAAEQLLSRYEYAGTTDLDADAVYQNGAWKPQNLQLDVADLSFLFKDFPYKTERLTGTLKVDESAKLGFHFVSKQGETLKAEIIGNYNDVFRYPAGEVIVRASGVPIDKKLLQSFPEQHLDVVNTLHPAGKINAMLRLVRPAGGLPLEKQFEIGLDRVSVMYDKFPYKLRDVYGILRLDDEAWTFDNIIGTNGSSAVRCSGHLRPVVTTGGAAGHELLINVRAEELPLDEQLYTAVLNPNQRELLTGLNFQGKTNLDAKIQFLMPKDELNLQFRAVPCANLSMKPNLFPYKIDNVRGEFYYNNGNISAKQIEAENGETKLKTGLDCRFNPDGSWSIALQPLNVKHLICNKELNDSLPENLRTVLETLQIGKPADMNGSIVFFKRNEQAPLWTVWNTNVLLRQNSAVLGFPAEDMFGEVRMSGYAKGAAVQLAGDIDLSSLNVKGFQTTELKGPFFYDGQDTHKQSYLFFGQQAGRVIPAPPNEPMLQNFAKLPWFTGAAAPRPLRGQFFGGTLLGEGLAVIEKNNFSYSIHSALYGADLAKLAKEKIPNASKFSGTLNCIDFHFHGSGAKLDTAAGSGTIQLRNANLFEAPGMVRVLRELSIRESDPNAGTFKEADIDFRSQGNQVQLDRLELAAENFYLQGGGSMRLDTQTVELAMKTRLGNRRMQIPVVSNIIGGAGDQFVQLNVHGPLSDPMIERAVLPEIQRTLQQIQDEAGGPPQVNSQPQQRGLFNRNPF
ncbi:MAG: AsmA-like C-terminal region-containing protein [Planctomycetaceae bacterium]|jgi:hypothetical protein|nr:AsmA-like C-terminal region-containing protein [Planctomycetaceae bacterium]